MNLSNFHVDSVSMVTQRHAAVNYTSFIYRENLLNQSKVSLRGQDVNTLAFYREMIPNCMFCDE